MNRLLLALYKPTSKIRGNPKMQYSKEVEEMICVAKGPNHGPAPIPEEGKWIQAKKIEDISAYTHGVAGAHRSRARAS